MESILLTVGLMETLIWAVVTQWLRVWITDQKVGGQAPNATKLLLMGP